MKPLLKYTSESAHIFVVFLITLFMLHCLQLFSIDVARIFSDRPQNRPLDPAQRSFHFLQDGTLHQIHTVRDPNHLGQLMEEVCDANNTLLRRRAASDDTPEANYLSFAGKLNRSYDRDTLNSRYTITPEFSRTFDIPVFANGMLREIWRYDHNREIFVGHDRSGAFLGCLGSQGLQPTPSNITGLGRLMEFQSWWSAEQGKQKLLWLTRHCLYEIDVKAKQVVRLVEENDSALEIMWIQAWYDVNRDERGYVDPNKYRPLIVCRASDNTYRLVLREPNQVVTFSPPEEWQQWVGDCQFSATKTDLFLKRSWTEFPAPPVNTGFSAAWQQWRHEFRSTKKRHRTELYRMDSQGQLEQVALGGWMETRVDNDIQLFSSHELNTLRLVKSLSPGLYRWIFTAIGPKTIHAFFRATGPNTLSLGLYEVVSWLCPTGTWDYLILSTMMTAIVFWHGRSRIISRKRLVFWLAFTYCFNLVGLLTYLALNHTAVVSCPACGKKRGLEQDACPRCSASLPQPNPPVLVRS